MCCDAVACRWIMRHTAKVIRQWPLPRQQSCEAMWCRNAKRPSSGNCSWRPLQVVWHCRYHAVVHLLCVCPVALVNKMLAVPITSCTCFVICSCASLSQSCVPMPASFLCTICNRLRCPEHIESWIELQWPLLRCTMCKRLRCPEHMEIFGSNCNGLAPECCSNVQ